MERVRQRDEHEWIILKEIAETLNSRNDMDDMLNSVLEKLLHVTGLESGWILLSEHEPDYTCAADCHLPPALRSRDRLAMRTDSCWCLMRLWSGELRGAVNTIGCKRIDDAIRFKWGDTAGITHHATVPLEAGGRHCGVLNVAAAGKEHFTADELALLQSVAYQIGTAIERTRLYHIQEKRARHYLKLGEAMRQLDEIRDVETVLDESAATIARTFGWSTVVILTEEAHGVSLRALCVDGEHRQVGADTTISRGHPVAAALRERRTVSVADAGGARDDCLAPGVPAFQSWVAVPVRLHDRHNAAMFVASPRRRDFDAVDLDVLPSLADHISLVFENLLLVEQRRRMTRSEERNRLARDLHDSVCQYLFSLTLVARGAESMMDRDVADRRLHLQEIQSLAQKALEEMRALIWQLRPEGLEQGLVTALQRYGESLGVRVCGQPRGVLELPPALEEALWRIGQEALNNVSKHARVDRADIVLGVSRRKVLMEVADGGCGFSVSGQGRESAMGMRTMRERAEALGGSVVVQSGASGTRVKVAIPYPGKAAVHEDSHSRGR